LRRANRIWRRGEGGSLSAKLPDLERRGGLGLVGGLSVPPDFGVSNTAPKEAIAGRYSNSQDLRNDMAILDAALSRQGIDHPLRDSREMC